jgi:hypothetical protein
MRKDFLFRSVNDYNGYTLAVTMVQREKNGCCSACFAEIRLEGS